jgi:formylglycine-generating enzyme required for sulfatase activity
MDLSAFVGKLLEEQDGDVLREGIRVLSQALMESEVADLIGADRHERTPDRTGHRNGYRMRTWDTRVGTIELAIPKVRPGTYFPSLLQPRRRAEHALLAVVQEAYVHGVSTRKVDELMKALGLDGVSKSEVSRICGELDPLVEEGQRRVTLSRPFYIGAHEVTVAQYRQFANEQKRVVSPGGVTTRVDGLNRFDPAASWSNVGFPQTDRHPAVYISWEDASQFCVWLSQKEGKLYRLPTEAEWEFAARGGTQSAYWWGEDITGAEKRANFGDQSYAKRFPDHDFKTGVDDGHVFTSEVGSFAANAFGLYDVSGNVFEWVQDVYGLLGPAPDRDPTGPPNGQFRVARGGGWATKPEGVRSAFRFREDPSLRFSGMGFRVVLQID